MLWPHSDARWRLGWQDVSDVQRDCLVRDIYDEKEIKASDPVPQTEVEDDLAPDVTLESKNLDIRRSGMARDCTRHHHDQVRSCAGSFDQRLPDCASELPKLPSKRLDTAGACLETLPLPGQDALPHLRRQTDQQHKPHQGNQDPYCADRGRKRTRNRETIPTILHSPEDHETKD